MRELLGTLIGNRYLVVNHIGGGGFGQTYLAEDTQLPNRRLCVVKHLMPIIKENSVIIPTPTDSEHFKVAKRLFQEEAKVLNKLGDRDDNNGFIPKLYAYIQEGQDFFVVQELVEGHNLDSEISGHKLPEQQVIDLLKKILLPLSFIHKNGVIHRDIKPKNLMRRTRDNQIVLIDFGAVKEVVSRTNNLDGESITVGIVSCGYTPHEQSMGKPVFGSDVYALGMIAIEALTGLHPSEATDLARDPANNNINWRELIQVNQGFGAILDKMICEDYHQRYQSAMEALNQLQEYEFRQLTPTQTSNMSVPIRLSTGQKL